MDETDRTLLALLAENARQPVATLARRLGLARSTVQARIDRLEASGAIAGYALRLGTAAAGETIRATVLITLEPRATPAVLTRLRAIGEVEVAHTASGRFDLILGLAAPSTAAIDAALDRIGAIPGVTGSETLIQLSTKIDRRRGLPA
jgi:DNA-binding Lrp family transcriptional regulator